MRTRGTGLLLAATLLALVPGSPAHAVYGTGRFRAVQVYLTDGTTEAFVDGYVGEGNSAGEIETPYGAYSFQFVCARVNSPLGSDVACDTMPVQVSWPLLSTASVKGTIGTITIDLSAVARAAPTLSPLVALGPYPIFANVGVIAFRPGTTTGSVTSSTVGGVAGTTGQTSLYGLTSVYGSPA